MLSLIVSSRSEQRGKGAESGTHYLFPPIGVSQGLLPKHLGELPDSEKCPIYKNLIAQATLIATRFISLSTLKVLKGKTQSQRQLLPMMKTGTNEFTFWLLALTNR